MLYVCNQLLPEDLKLNLLRSKWEKSSSSRSSSSLIILASHISDRQDILATDGGQITSLKHLYFLVINRWKIIIYNLTLRPQMSYSTPNYKTQPSGDDFDVYFVHLKRICKCILNERNKPLIL